MVKVGFYFMLGRQSCVIQAGKKEEQKGNID